MVELGGIHWKPYFLNKDLKGIIKLNCNALAQSHIEDFLRKYGLTPNYAIQHKEENTSTQIFYIKKAHYVLKTFREALMYKIRGTKEKDNPTYLQIASNVLHKKMEEVQLNTETTKINTYKDYLKTKDTMEPLIPGRSRKEIITFKLTNQDLPYNNYNEFRKRNKKENQKDYGPLIVTNDFETIHLLRLKEYKTEQEKY